MSAFTDGQPDFTSPIGLVAGNGTLPFEFIRGAKSRGLDVVAVAHVGETDKRLNDELKNVLWVKIGELGKVFEFFKSHGVKDASFAGGITRVKIFGGVKLDARAMALLPKIISVRDDSILRVIAREFETEGIHIFSPAKLLQSNVNEACVLTRRALTLEERENAKIGWEAARAAGALDIGQTVVAAHGVVVAVEAVEGTDETIKRGGTLAGKGAVVVKLCKPAQDLRLDLPTVGKKTIETMKAAGATALILEAGKCIVLDRDELVAAANKADISIIAAANMDDLGLPAGA